MRDWESQLQGSVQSQVGTGTRSPARGWWLKGVPAPTGAWGSVCCAVSKTLPLQKKKKKMNGPQNQEGKNESTEKDTESGRRGTDSIKCNGVPGRCPAARAVSWWCLCDRQGDWVHYSKKKCLWALVSLWEILWASKKTVIEMSENNVDSLGEVQTCKGKGMVNSQRMVNSCDHLDRTRNASDFCVFNVVSCNFT